MIKWIRDFESSRIQTQKLRILINVLNTAIFGISGVSEYPYQETSVQLIMASRFIDAIRDDILSYLILSSSNAYDRMGREYHIFIENIQDVRMYGMCNEDDQKICESFSHICSILSSQILKK